MYSSGMATLSSFIVHQGDCFNLLSIMLLSMRLLVFNGCGGPLDLDLGFERHLNTLISGSGRLPD